MYDVLTKTGDGLHLTFKVPQYSYREDPRLLIS